MRSLAVYRDGVLAGILREEHRQRYTFHYDPSYFLDPDRPAISVTLPKTSPEYESPYLFPFFFNLLSEGENLRMQCLRLRIDETDHFGLLMATAQYDTIGAVTLKSIGEHGQS